jgi:hypothetical protein
MFEQLSSHPKRWAGNVSPVRMGAPPRSVEDDSSLMSNDHCAAGRVGRCLTTPMTRRRKML